MNDTRVVDVQEYYGNILATKDDLKTSACCPIDTLAEYLKPLVARVHNEVQEKFYGCGSPIPYDITGCTVLDLGCGSGRDVYTLSQLVGKDGHVIGVDMTENQLAVAKKHLDYHMDSFGFTTPNVTLHHGFIEDLQASGIADQSVDIVVSNCVINLSSNKEAVFREIFRILKPGGELYFSDIVTNRRIPDHLTTDPVLVGECLGGALYTEDLRRTLASAGFIDHRTVNKSAVALHNPEVEQKAGMIDFYSVNIRTFKCEFEDVCEDYGHVACYQGTISHTPHQFVLDNHHLFKTGKPVRVCGNTAKMLSETRYRRHFKVTGDFSTHYGIFDCAAEPATIFNSGACC